MKVGLCVVVGAGDQSEERVLIDIMAHPTSLRLNGIGCAIIVGVWITGVVEGEREPIGLGRRW